MKFLCPLITVIIIGYFFSGCSGTSETKYEVKIPEWYLKPPKDTTFLFSTKSSSKKDIQQVLDDAIIFGRMDISNQLEKQLQNWGKKFDLDVGMNKDDILFYNFDQIINSVIDKTRNMINVLKKEIVKDGDNWRAYVLLSFELGIANQSLLIQLNGNKELVSKLKPSKTYDELDIEVQRYLRLKKKQFSDH
jgi:hypothetical protein